MNGDTPAEWLEKRARELEETDEYAPTEAERRAHARETHEPKGRRK